MAFAARFTVVVLATAAAVGLKAQTLQVRAEAGRIRVSTPTSLFFDESSLERLHNGAPVVFAVHLTLLTNSKGTVLARTAGRFAVSFDIWDEKFAVTRVGNPRSSKSHLAAAEAEAWCLESLVLSPAALSPDTPFWIRLDVRTEGPSERPAPGDEGGFTLARLVDTFSRLRREGEVRRQAEAGPLRLRDLH